ncbi:MAG: hypothetical protein AB7S38_41695 [Vulcanimicrobiota bacterium]
MLGKIGPLTTATPLPARPAASRPQAQPALITDSVEARPLDFREFLTQKKLPDWIKADAKKALESFRPDLQARLREAGVRITFTKDPNQGGTFNPLTKEITVLADDRKNMRTYLLHELTHAVDYLEGRADLGLAGRVATPFSAQYFSRRDPNLAELHKNSVRRAHRQLAYDVQQARLKGKTDFTDLPFPYRACQVEEKDGRLLMTETASSRIQRFYVNAGPSLPIAAAINAVGVTLSLAGAPLIGVPVLALGAKYTAEVVKAWRRENDLATFADDQIISRPGFIEATIPDQNPDSMISAYAATERRPEEYLAEAMADYLHSPEKRAHLLKVDPDMHAYCQNLGWDA